MTADSLIAFHAERAQAYRSLASLLFAPEQVSPELRPPRPPVDPPAGLIELHEALRLAPSAPAERARLGALAGAVRCLAPHAPLRLAAFAAAGVTPTEACAAGLLVLAGLADRAARALAQGCLPEACEASDLRRRFLFEHACHCLKQVASALAREGPLGQRVAAALGMLLEEDAGLLGSSGEVPGG